MHYAETLNGALFCLTLPPDDLNDWPRLLEGLVCRVEQIPAFLENAQARLLNAPAVLTPFFAVGPDPLTLTGGRAT